MRQGFTRLDATPGIIRMVDGIIVRDVPQLSMFAADVDTTWPESWRAVQIIPIFQGIASAGRIVRPPAGAALGV